MVLRCVPTDVPVHRGSVGAMAVTAGSQMPPRITRPYVYRGTGEDQFPETTDARYGREEVPGYYEGPKKPKAPTVEEYKEREVKAARAREVARMKRKAKRLREERWAQEAAARRAQFTYQPKPVFLDDLDVEAPEPAPPPPRPRKPVRPAPEWKPLSGADLDALLDEID